MPKRKAAVKDYVQLVNGIPLLGEIVVWQGAKNSYTNVVQALKDAGLDHEVARAFMPAQAFNRAIKTLETKRVIEELSRDKHEVVFQLTQYHRVHNAADGEDELEYKKETKVHLDRTTGVITCKNADIRRQAQDELDRCLEERTPSDITNIVQALFTKYQAEHPTGELIRVRDQGGAYFVLAPHLAFVDRVKQFLDAVGGTVTRWPIPAGTKHGDAAVQESVEGHLRALVDEHRAEVAKFTTHTRADTIKAAADKINLLRVKIEAYAHYLDEKKAALLTGLDDNNAYLVQRAQDLDAERQANPTPSVDLDNKLLAGLDPASPRKPKEIKEAAGIEQSIPIHGRLQRLIKAGLAAEAGGGYVRKNGAPAAPQP